MKIMGNKLHNLVSVSSYGAVGDGITDDTDAIQTAINAAKNIHIPIGTYLISSSLRVPSDRNIFGDGFGSILKKTHENVDHVIINLDIVNGNTNIILGNFQIDGSRFPDTHYEPNKNAIYLTKCSQCVVSQLLITNCKNDGIIIEYGGNNIIKDCIVSNCAKQGIYLSGTEHCNVVNNNCHTNFGGIAIAASWYCAISANVCNKNTSMEMCMSRDSRYNTINGNTLGPGAFYGYNLHLMSVTTTADISNEGHNLVIVALVGTDLHIRIFDVSGIKVVDKAENELVGGETLTTFKKRLSPLPDESSLSYQQKQEIIQNATSLAGHTQSYALFNHVEPITPQQTLHNILYPGSDTCYGIKFCTFTGNIFLGCVRSILVDDSLITGNLFSNSNAQGVCFHGGKRNRVHGNRIIDWNGSNNLAGLQLTSLNKTDFGENPPTSMSFPIHSDNNTISDNDIYHENSDLAKPVDNGSGNLFFGNRINGTLDCKCVSLTK